MLELERPGLSLVTGDPARDVFLDVAELVGGQAGAIEAPQVLAVMLAGMHEPVMLGKR